MKNSEEQLNEIETSCWVDDGGFLGFFKWNGTNHTLASSRPVTQRVACRIESMGLWVLRRPVTLTRKSLENMAPLKTWLETCEDLQIDIIDSQANTQAQFFLDEWRKKVVIVRITSHSNKA